MGRQWIVASLGSFAAVAMGCCGSAPDPARPGPPARSAARALVVTEIDQADVVNRPPHFRSLAPITAQAGRVYSYDFSALDPDGDEVTYTLVAAPAGASLDGQALTWVPAPDQVARPQRFTLRAVDELGAAEDQEWSVAPMPSGDQPVSPGVRPHTAPFPAGPPQPGRRPAPRSAPADNRFP